MSSRSPSRRYEVSRRYGVSRPSELSRRCEPSAGFAPGLRLVPRIAPGEQRVQPHLVVQGLGPADGGEVVRRAGRGGEQPVRVERDADFPGAGRAQGADGKAVADQEVVGGGQRAAALLCAGGVGARGVADEGAAVWLVEGDPAGHPVAEPLRDQSGVVREALRRLAHPPAAPVFQSLGEVPVVEGGGGGDPGGQQFVDQPVVEVQTGGVGRTCAVGLDPRPGDGEAVAVHAEATQQSHVLAVAVVVVAGDVAGGAARHPSGLATVGVPDGRPSAVLVVRPLDLVARRGGAEEEAVGEFREFGGAHAAEALIAT